MRHRKAGRQLAAPASRSSRCMRNLATSLIEHGAIETTEAKAKELRPFVEKLITQGEAQARCTRAASPAVTSRSASSATSCSRRSGPKFATRAGGYTRILKTGHRKGDGAEMARIELVES